MARDTIEILRELYAAAPELLPRIKAGEDISGHPYLDFWDPDCTVQELAEVPDTAAYHGHEGLIRYFAGLLELWDVIDYRPLDFTEGDDGIVVSIELFGRSVSGLEATMPVWQVFKLREGRIVYATAYMDRGAAREAVGLPATGD
jgi:ketosteroid isomerase-like protein